jgi:hypothetical protein
MPILVFGDNTGDDYSGTDAFNLFEAAPSTSQTNLDIGKYSSGSWRMGVVAFSGLSNLPSSITVSSAIVTAYLENTNTSNSHTFQSRRLLRNWVYGQATWNQYSTGNNWATGGAGASSDRSSVVSTVSQVVGSAGNSYELLQDSAQLKSDVEDIASGSNPNYGWRIERNDSANDSRYKLFTNDSGTDGNRPYLTVNYTASGGTALVMTIGESITAADESTGRLSALLSVSESAGASDIDQGQYATSQEMIEAVQANDLTTALFNALLTQNLGAIASDSVSFKAKFGLTLNELAAGTDSDTGKASYLTTLSESLSGSDSLSFTTPRIILTIGETVASSDNLSISAHFKMTIGESANITDSASSKASLISNIAEAISSSDAFNRISVFSLTIGEAVSAIDLLSASNPNLLGLITATITIDPLITANSVINPLISGTITAIPTITGTIKVT